MTAADPASKRQEKRDFCGISRVTSIRVKGRIFFAQERHVAREKERGRNCTSAAVTFLFTPRIVRPLFLILLWIYHCTYIKHIFRESARIKGEVLVYSNIAGEFYIMLCVLLWLSLIVTVIVIVTAAIIFINVILISNSIIIFLIIIIILLLLTIDYKYYYYYYY